MDLQRLHRITAMAWRMRLKLPSFQVTQRTGTGSTVRRNLPRGRKDDCVEDEQLSSGGEVGSSDLTSSTDFFPTSFDTVTEDKGCSSQPEVSLHAIKQKAATAAWTQVRPALLKAAVECSAMPVAQCCILCLESAFSVHLGPTFAKIASVRFIPRSPSFTLEKFGRYVDETAVLGTACRHEFPHMFINLKHGER